MKCIQIAEQIATRLEPVLRSLPDGFYGSFAFTQTGNNLTHPVTLGLLSRVLWTLPGIDLVAIDVRLNLGSGVKFQPDLVGYDSKLQPVVAVDYESPNSSDARIPVKDVDAFLAWRRQSGIDLPYIVITTLPDRAEPSWELRWTAPSKWNEAFCGRRDELCRNPLLFWQAHYAEEFAKRAVQDIAMLNIDGTSVRRIYPT